MGSCIIQGRLKNAFVTKVGDFVKLTSNTTPAPFSISWKDLLYASSSSSSGTLISSSNEYKVYNGNTSSIIGYAGSHHMWNGDTYVDVSFGGKMIIPLQVTLYFEGSASSNKKIFVSALDSSGNSIDNIVLLSSGSSGVYNVSSEIECYGLRFGASCTPYNSIGLINCSINKWKQKIRA